MATKVNVVLGGHGGGTYQVSEVETLAELAVKVQAAEDLFGRVMLEARVYGFEGMYGGALPMRDVTPEDFTLEADGEDFEFTSLVDDCGDAVKSVTVTVPRRS